MSTHAALPPDASPSAEKDREVARLAGGYTQLQRLLEMTGITVWTGLALMTLARAVALGAVLQLAWPQVAAAALLAVVGGLLFADFASGLVHWAADNWGSDDWPVLGAAFIRPFRLHHLDAEDITRHTFLELNGNNCIVSLPVFWFANHALGSSSWSGVAWGTFWLSVAVWVLATNQFHCWAHTARPPAWVRALQRAGLILSTPHHDVHHRSPHAANYCITTGWFNAPLRTMRFFEGLEWVLTKVSGVPAHHHTLSGE